MSATKIILTSIHGRLLGLSALGKLIVKGRQAVTMNDAGAAASIQGAPTAVNTTATMTVAGLLSGIITSTTAAAVTGTLPTGTLTDAGADLDIDEAFNWSVINTGPNTFTVAAGTGHTIVGLATVATATSAQFRTRKTAVNTFVTYRIAV